MKLSFEFSMEDWMAFQKFHNAKLFVKSKKVTLFAIPILLFVLALNEALKKEIDVFLISLLVLPAIIWPILMSFRFDKSYWNRIQNVLEAGDNSGFLCVHDIELSDDGIRVRYSNTQTEIKWPGINRFEETDTYYFLYETSVSAIIIPKEKVDLKVDELNALLHEKLGHLSNQV